MSLFGQVEQWLFSVALKKVTARVAVFVAAKLAAVKLESYGVAVSINPDMFAAGILAGAHWVLDWAKTKGWLPKWAA